jgi:hypothetical protein
MGEISVGTHTVVRDMGLGEYEQRRWIFRDDDGATFIQESCDDLPGVPEHARFQDKVVA